MYEQGDDHHTNPVSGFELRDDDRAAVDAHFSATTARALTGSAPSASRHCSA